MIEKEEIAPLTEVILDLSRKKDPVIAAIDGRCAAGKSTLAAWLAERFGWAVIHMDDFYLRPEQRTPARYEEPGGNADRERLLEEVLIPLAENRLTSYRPFDCGTMELADPVPVMPTPVVLLEGAYSCHPDLRDRYDLRIFVDIGPEEQLRRIYEREGPERASVFREKWIPLEERYLKAFSIREHCEFYLRLY